jgi:hypothetical protein
MEESAMHRDFTHNNLGVRVYANECTIVEKKAGVVGWVEDGQRFPLPLLAGFDTVQAIPASRLAVAFKAYESHNPDSPLREVLTQQVAAPGNKL